MISAIGVCAIVIAEYINLDGPSWGQKCTSIKHTLKPKNPYA